MCFMLALLLRLLALGLNALPLLLVDPRLFGLFVVCLLVTATFGLVVAGLFIAF